MKPSEILKAEGHKFIQIQGRMSGNAPNERCAVGLIYYTKVTDNWALNASSSLMNSSERSAFEMLKTNIPCPTDNKCQSHSNCVMHITMHLNDKHGWSFQKIADYLESIGS